MQDRVELMYVVGDYAEEMAESFAFAKLASFLRYFTYTLNRNCVRTNYLLVLAMLRM